MSVSSTGVQGNDYSSLGLPSDDGRYVAFTSRATNLVPGDLNGHEDAFLKDRVSGALTLVSTNAAGEHGDHFSLARDMTPDGTAILFGSYASNLVPDDTNGKRDVFLKSVLTGDVQRVSLGTNGQEPVYYSSAAGMSHDAQVLGFRCEDGTLVPGSDSHPHTYVRNLCPASWSTYGEGHPGTHGEPTIALDSRPVVDSDPNLLVTNSSNGPTISMVVGSLQTAELPIYGGTLLVGAPYLERYIGQLGIGPNAIPVAIPDDPALCGTTWYYQVLMRDPGASHNVSFTPGIAMTLGH